jgi:hypothetical protein
MTDQSSGDLSPSTPPTAPASSPTSWAADRKNEQTARHQPPPARRLPQEPNPNVPKPPDWDRSGGMNR